VPLLTSTASDAKGAFELQGVSAGRFTLAVSAANHHHKLSSGLTLRAGGELGPLRIDLEPTAPGEEPKLELQGIGAVLRPQGDAIIVGYVVPDSGAAQAGLANGDRVLAVDGESVTSLGFQGTIEHIRGPEGTAVRLQIRRGETESHLVVERRRMRR
jgi:predicted metalloprotease with PDZ domain